MRYTEVTKSDFDECFGHLDPIKIPEIDFPIYTLNWFDRIGVKSGKEVTDYSVKPPKKSYYLYI